MLPSIHHHHSTYKAVYAVRNQHCSPSLHLFATFATATVATTIASVTNKSTGRTVYCRLLRCRRRCRHCCTAPALAPTAILLHRASEFVDCFISLTIGLGARFCDALKRASELSAVVFISPSPTRAESSLPCSPGETGFERDRQRLATRSLARFGAQKSPMSKDHPEQGPYSSAHWTNQSREQYPPPPQQGSYPAPSPYSQQSPHAPANSSDMLTLPPPSQMPQQDPYRDHPPQYDMYQGQPGQMPYPTGPHPNSQQQPVSFAQPAPRQRTAIACRYCRRRKVCLSGLPRSTDRTMS